MYTRSMARQLIVELDEPLARELERAAPARSRLRSSFVRAALRRALDELADSRMTKAYAAQPDVEPAHFDSRLWERGATTRGSKRKRR
jgi:metal-responsive CopG/Arc/MetJ family transcriptional regulator